MLDELHVDSSVFPGALKDPCSVVDADHICNSFCIELQFLGLFILILRLPCFKALDATSRLLLLWWLLRLEEVGALWIDAASADSSHGVHVLQ